METKKPEHLPTWQGSDSLHYQNEVRREWDHEETSFRPGNRVVVKGPDTVWDAEGREHLLAKGTQWMVTEICHDPGWTTRLGGLPRSGHVCVGWDVLTRDEALNEVKDHEQ